MEKPQNAGGAARTSEVAPYPGTPRWVYVFGLIVIVPVVVFIIRHLTRGGLAGHAH